MKITVLTLFPKMISGFFNESIVQRAQEKELVEIEVVDLRKFAVDRYGSVDDRPYGGGAGMVMRVDVIYKAILNIKDQRSKRHTKNKKERIILTSPKGKVFNQQLAISYSKLNHLVIVAGHYEGVDERVRDFVDEEISIGDFVTTGGEIAASAIVDSVVRLIPGVLKKEEASQSESFMNASIDPSTSSGQVDLIEAVGIDNPVLKKLIKKGVKEVKLLEYPQYTRPEEFMGKKAPKILLSGNHKEIEKWRIKKAFEETLKRRPDLLKVI